MAACEGLIFNEPLNGGTKCRYNIILNKKNQLILNLFFCSRTSNSSELEKTRNSEVGVTKVLEVTESGFYYFIFANENEIQDNFLSAKFDLHKTGTIHILRRHILRLFGPPSPTPYVSMFYVLQISKNCRFLTPLPLYYTSAYVIFEWSNSF